MFLSFLDRQCLTILLIAVHGRYIIAFVKVILNLQNAEAMLIGIAIGEILLNTVQFSSISLPTQRKTQPQGCCSVCSTFQGASCTPGCNVQKRTFRATACTPQCRITNADEEWRGRNYIHLQYQQDNRRIGGNKKRTQNCAVKLSGRKFISWETQNWTLVS